MSSKDFRELHRFDTSSTRRYRAQLRAHLSMELCHWLHLNAIRISDAFDRPSIANDNRWTWNDAAHVRKNKRKLVVLYSCNPDETNQ